MALEKQRKTFLSYSRVNQDFAVQLAKELKSEGFDVWLDTLDIPLGARWDREVEKALRQSEIFMIILTPESVDSENVLDEIGYAIDTSKRILPILLENCEVPLRLRRLQYVNFTDKSFEEGVSAAKGLLRGLTAQSTIPREESATDVQVKKGGKEEDANRKAKDEADRRAKEEADRLALQIAAADRKAKEEVERLAKAEADRKKRELVDRKPKPEKKPGSGPSPTPQKKSLSGGLVAGVIAFVVLCVAGVGLTISTFSKGNTQATKSPGVSPTSTRQSPVSTPQPTNTPRPTPTPIPLPTILDASKAKELKDNSIQAYALAGEQLSDERLGDLFNSQQQIPLSIDVSDGPVFFNLGWCAKTQDILENNIAHMDFPVTFNEKIVPDTQVYRYYYESGGQFCYGSVLVVDDWIKGEYIITLENVILQKINDGFEDYDPETFVHQFVVTVP